MSDQNAGSGPEPLQFDRAEDAGAAAGASAAMQCSSCNSAIRSYYYQVGGSIVCARCKQIAERAVGSQRGWGAFARAAIFGGVAALVGAGIYYGVIAITNFEIGIVALLIGFLVGYAVRMGARGGGGRRYQILALGLTYFAVGLAYAPLFIKGARDAIREGADSAAVADTLAGDEEDSASVVAEAAEEDSTEVRLAGVGATDTTAAITMGAGAAVLGLLILTAGTFFMIFALPVLAVVGSLPSGLISALIIGFGMHQAWKMTGGQLVEITGPYKVATESPPEPAPAT